MKVIFNIAPCALALLAASCVKLEVDPKSFAGEGLPPEIENCPDCALEEQPLRGELIAFVNARLSDRVANYTVNYPIGPDDCDGQEFSCFVGPAIYLYDPTLECDDAPACRVARLGHLWLDARLGEVSVGDQSLKRFTLRDIAWHPGFGFWGISYDSLNDEWGLAAFDVADWTRADNHIGVDRYTIRAGPIDDPATDPCYWRFNMSALGFVGNRLYAGSAGAEGALYEIDPDFLLKPGYSPHPNDSSQDPTYYADRALCSIVTQFADSRGVAGDITRARDDDDAALAMVDAQLDDSELDLGRNALYSLSGGAMLDTGPFFDALESGQKIDSLARVDGVLYGLDTRGAVYVIDEPTEPGGSDWSIRQHDDLAPLFEEPEYSLLLRGAATVRVD